MGEASLFGYLTMISLLGFGLKGMNQGSYSIRLLGTWRLACNGDEQAFIDGGRGVGIPIIMGLALSSRKVP